MLLHKHGTTGKSYNDPDYEEFLCATDRTIQLWVQVEEPGANNDESAVEFSETPTVVTNGPSVLTESTVTDQSAAQANTLFVAIEEMSAWTEDTQSQEPEPSDLNEVPVTLEDSGAAASYINLGRRVRVPQLMVSIAGADHMIR